MTTFRERDAFIPSDALGFPTNTAIFPFQEPSNLFGLWPVRLILEKR